jgi:mono/diheme cytochrome c family protein
VKINTVAIAGVLLAAGSLPADSEDKVNVPAVDFSRGVYPIFVEHCISCHGTKRQEGGLRLDTRDAALRGGDSGKAIVAKNVSGSLMIQRVTESDVVLRMPLKKPALSPSQVRTLRSWIRAGAVWPEKRSASDGRIVSDHWSFQPIKRPSVPATDSNASDSNIDPFVWQRLKGAGFDVSPRAGRRTLIRRLFLDLTGLPPAPDVVREFLLDEQPDAWVRLVDRVLASPHFGERWSQHWLDLARYADSDGYEMDYYRPNAWRWRDWLIRAINDDMPFDQFTIEQLAGDLLPEATTEQILATGFHRNSLKNTENGIDAEEYRVKAIVDRVNTTGTVWLGLTVGCSECHSHKYDPIVQHEYYGLFAFFNDRVDESQITVPVTVYDRERIATARRKYEQQIREAEKQLVRAKGDDREKIKKTLQGLRAARDNIETTASVFQRRSKPRTTRVHIRGSFLERGDKVSPSIPAALLQIGQSKVETRLDLARWIVSPQNPLTARVEANRIWQALFGQGLVRTPDDFGTQGDRPTHPLLLDWLASELRDNGWSRKQLIRQIVTSATYCQSSLNRPEYAERDPENRLLWRQNRFRIAAECLRDQYLAASGLLNDQIGGPSFDPPLPEGLAKLAFRVAWKPDAHHEQLRRGMYIATRRNLAVPLLTSFDRPDANVTCTQRERSNTPMQSLAQLNDPLFVSAAANLALIETTRTSGFDTRLQGMFERCLSRAPTTSESEIFRHLHRRLLAAYSDSPESIIAPPGVEQREYTIDDAAWTVLARTIMNLDEFTTRE